MQKHLGSSVQNYIVAARTAQGYEDWHNSTQAERHDVISRWQAIQVDIEKERKLARHGSFSGNHCYLKATIEQRKKKIAEKKAKKKHDKEIHHDDDDEHTETPSAHPFVTQSRQPKDVSTVAEGDDFEEAVKASVAATSKGDLEQDKMIEQAIRASVRELQTAQKEGDEDAMQRAIKASVAEAARIRKEQVAAGHNSTDEYHDEELELALHRSVSHHPPRDHVHPLANADFDDSGVDTDDDENMKTAIERSKSGSINHSHRQVPVDKHLEKAIETSKRDHEERQRTDEEVVMEYVKKQSLLEDEHRKNMASKEVI